jgi:hypothetical protein
MEVMKTIQFPAQNTTSRVIQHRLISTAGVVDSGSGEFPKNKMSC